MTWNFFSAKEHFKFHSSAWDSLNTSLFSSHPLLDSRFVLYLIKHFADHCVVLAIHGDPRKPDSMAIVEKNNFYCWSLFLPSQAQIAPSLISDYKHAVSLLRSLPGFPIQLDILAQDPDSSYLTKSSSLSVEMPHALTMNIIIDSDFEKYWLNRSKNLRKNISRYLRRLKNNGVYFDIKTITDSEELIFALERYGHLESSGWKKSRGTAIHIKNKQGEFYRDILEAYSDSHQAIVYELYFNGRLAASRISIKNESMLVILKTTYDEGFKQYAPGRLLLYLILKNVFSEKSPYKIEFYTNANNDQLSWCSSSRWISHISLHRNALVSYAVRNYKYVKNFLFRS